LIAAVARDESQNTEVVLLDPRDVRQFGLVEAHVLRAVRFGRETHKGVDQLRFRRLVHHPVDVRRVVRQSVHDETAVVVPESDRRQFRAVLHRRRYRAVLGPTEKRAGR